MDNREQALPRGILWGVALVTLTLTAGLAINVSPALRGPDSWRWAYAIPGQPWRHLLPFATVTAYVAILALIWRRVRPGVTEPNRAWTIRVLVLLAVCVPLLQAALLYPESPDVLRPLFYRTISAGASGVFTVGSRIQEPLTFLRAYPKLMPTFPVHPQRYPPGLAMLFYVARRIFAAAPTLADPIGFGLRRTQCHDLALMRLSNATLASAIIQMTLPIVSGLIVFPLYGLGRAIAGKRAGLLAAGLYPLIPSFALWSGRWDAFYPLLTCAASYCFYAGLTRDRPLQLAIAGLTLSLTTFLTFGVVVMLMPLGLIGVLWALTSPNQPGVKRLGIGALCFFAGLILPWATYRLAVGHGFLAIWRVSMSYHLGLARDYWTWLGYHLYDFFLFLGLPISGLFILAIPGAIRRPGAGRGILTLAWGVSLLVLVLSGVARGEVARVWLFLTPFPVIAAASTLADGASSPRRWLSVAALLAVQLLVFNAFLRVVTTGVTDPPSRERHFDVPEVTHAVDATFGNEIALLGYDLNPNQVVAGKPLTLTLTWKTLKPIRHSYTVFNHLVTPGGTLLAQQDGLPYEGRAPTTCWVPGEVVTDTFVLVVPTGAEIDQARLLTGLYRWETGERLAVTGSDATPNRAVRLTEAQVHPDASGD